MQTLWAQQLLRVIERESPVSVFVVVLVWVVHPLGGAPTWTPTTPGTPT
ncbi:MAG: hypothetical protein ABSD09_07545 [Xanthobacteraceae bacterium]